MCIIKTIKKAYIQMTMCQKIQTHAIRKIFLKKRMKQKHLFLPPTNTEMSYIMCIAVHYFKEVMRRSNSYFQSSSRSVHYERFHILVLVQMRCANGCILSSQNVFMVSEEKHLLSVKKVNCCRTSSVSVLWEYLIHGTSLYWYFLGDSLLSHSHIHYETAILNKLYYRILNYTAYMNKK